MVEAHAQQSGPRPHASSPHSPRTQALSHGLHTVGRASPRTTRSGGPAQAGRAANVRREARSRVPKSSSERHAIARRGRPSREKVSLISKCMQGVHRGFLLLSRARCAHPHPEQHEAGRPRHTAPARPSITQKQAEPGERRGSRVRGRGREAERPRPPALLKGGLCPNGPYSHSRYPPSPYAGRGGRRGSFAPPPTASAIPPLSP